MEVNYFHSLFLILVMKISLQDNEL